MRQAIGEVLPLAIAAAISPFPIIGVVLMAPVSSYTSIYGVRLAHWLPRRGLEIGFGIFLVLAASRFVVSLL